MVKPEDFTIIKRVDPFNVSFDVIMHCRWSESIDTKEIVNTPADQWSKLLETRQREAYSGFLRYVYGDLMELLLEVRDKVEDQSKEWKEVNEKIFELDRLMTVPLERLEYQDQNKDDV